MKQIRLTFYLVVAGMMAAHVASAEIIRGINMDFVNIGSAGNAADTRSMPFDGAHCGAVNYNYRIGKYEVSNAQWNAFIATAGAPQGNGYGYGYSSYWNKPYWNIPDLPTNYVSWFEAAQFCNYLTSGDKSKGAYLFSGNNANAGNFLGINRDAAISMYGTVFVIPTQDEWYKAAYFKPDGSGYSVYSNGSSTVPPFDGWNYNGRGMGEYNGPWDVLLGYKEQNGTYNMMGNLWEWTENTVNNTYSSRRGGSYVLYDTIDYIMWSSRQSSQMAWEDQYSGFRIASIPEPCSLVLLGLGGMALRLRKK